MAKRSPLGRGLGALISTSHNTESVSHDADQAQTDAEAGLINASMDAIIPSPWQPRQVFDEARLEELADSLREQGLVQPLVVRKRGDQFELIAGERRFRAAERLAWKTIPVIILDATDEKTREMALVENLQRDDLNPLEIAHAYQSMADDLELTHQQIADRLGVSRARVTNTLRLLELPDDVRSLVSGGALSAGHARTLLALPDAMSQIQLARKIVAENLSVRDVERLIHRASSHGEPKKSAKSKSRNISPHVRDLEERLRQHFGTKVVIKENNGRGQITIEFYNHDDVTRILQTLNLPGDLS